MGGQTALNCALDLDKYGVLAKYDCELIGATKEAIEKAEDRELFDKVMKKIGLECPRADIAETMEQALEIQSRFGFPVIIRPSFTMGGSGGGIAYNKEEFIEICERGFDLSPTHQLLIDESLIGWKEYEMEVVRDKKTTASSSALSRTLTRWVCTQVTPSPSHLLRPLLTKNISSCVMHLSPYCVRLV